MFREVPALVVVVPLAGIVLATLLWHLHRGQRLTGPRAFVALVLCVYAAGVVANTVFPIFLDKPPRSASWTTALSFTPLVGYDVADAVMNIVVFVPIGMLIPLVTPAASWGRVVGTAAAFSMAVEGTQFVTANLLGGGHVADVNDLSFNVLGAAVGFAVLSALTCVPVLSRLAKRFYWR